MGRSCGHRASELKGALEVCFQPDPLLGLMEVHPGSPQRAREWAACFHVSVHYGALLWGMSGTRQAPSAPHRATAL